MGTALRSVLRGLLWATGVLVVCLTTIMWFLGFENIFASDLTFFGFWVLTLFVIGWLPIFVLVTGWNVVWNLITGRAGRAHNSPANNDSEHKAPYG
jgi:hypothetical protein